jgi:hypothetical protein
VRFAHAWPPTVSHPRAGSTISYSKGAGEGHSVRGPRAAAHEGNGKRQSLSRARPGYAQIACHLASDPAESANHVMVGQRVDHPLHTALLEQTGEPTGYEELSQRNESVRERTHAEDDEPNLERAGRGIMALRGGEEFVILLFGERAGDAVALAERR